MRPYFIARLALVSCTALLIAPAYGTSTNAATLDNIAKSSVPFVRNAGQWDARAAFAAHTFAGTLFVTTQGELVYSLLGKPVAADAAGSSADDAASAAPLQVRALGRALADRPKQRSLGWVLRETLVDSKGHPRAMSQSTVNAPAGYRPMEGKASYGIGNDTSKHADNLNTYERVNLGDMYPGINVQLRATGTNVEKIFTVAPHHDAGQININLAGAEKLEIGDKGELIAHTGNGPVAFTAPVAFQENASGERTPVNVAYALDAHEQRYGFTIADYDATLPLVIDPLLQSTYAGGAGSDLIEAMAIHPINGEIYVAGRSDSSDFPGVSGGAQSVKSTGIDAFVARFNAALTTRLQSTYFGGTGTDIAYALAIHPTSGEVYIAGSTNSTDVPGLAGGAQGTKSGGTDAFVTRFDAALTSHLQSSYLGGTGTDSAAAIAIDPATGEVYIAGFTTSNDLPAVAGGAQGANAGGNDAFVARLNAALTSHLQSSYLGGTGTDSATAMAIHGTTGEVYIAGFTSSTDLLGVAGGAQSLKSTGDDAFVTRFNAALTSSMQSSYLGGTGIDSATAMAIHPGTGEIYLAGYTDASDLPGVAGGAQSVKSGSNDAFVTRFNAALTSRLQSSYLGGTGPDYAYAMAIHPATGDVYLAGRTDSTDLPGVAGGIQSVKSVSPDAFVTRFNAALDSRLQSSYLGGTSIDTAFALAIHPANGEVYLAGFSSSADLPGVTGGAQSVKATGTDAFVSRVSADLKGCNLDIDRDTVVRASTDGVLILRRMLGMSGAALIANAVNPSGAQTGDVTIANAIDALLSTLDLDGDATTNAASDGLMLLRAMLGFTGASVTNGAVVGSPPRNTWSLIRQYLNSGCATNFLP